MAEIKIIGVKTRSRLTRIIPDKVKIAIAEALMAFAEMEVSAEKLIWDLTGLSSDDGRLLTQMDAKPKFELARKLSTRYSVPPHPHPQTIKDFWHQTKLLMEARNKIAHGVWLMLDKKIPFAASFRIPADLGRATGEVFRIKRLRAIAAACEKTKERLDEMALKHLAAPSKPLGRTRPTNPSQKQSHRKHDQ